MIVLFVPMFIAGIVMMVKNPSLLASRLDAKEKQIDALITAGQIGKIISNKVAMAA